MVFNVACKTQVCLTPNVVHTHGHYTYENGIPTEIRKGILDFFEYEYTKYVISYTPVPRETPDCNWHDL
jgi:hypothetical protein